MMIPTNCVSIAMKNNSARLTRGALLQIVGYSIRPEYLLGKA